MGVVLLVLGGFAVGCLVTWVGAEAVMRHGRNRLVKDVIEGRTVSDQLRRIAREIREEAQKR